MRTKYSGKSIPGNIRKELQFQLKCASLTDLKRVDFTNALNEINAAVWKRFRENPGYAKYFKFKGDKAKNNKDFFTAKSLHRYFDGKPIRTDKLQALMCFLNYEPDRLEPANDNKKQSSDNFQFESLRGAWFSYVYDTSEPTLNKVKRTVLFINTKNQQFLDVQYESLKGRFTGYAEIIKNSILFYIESADKDVHIFLCAELPVDRSNEHSHQVILNVFCLANSISGQPVVSNVILVKNNKDSIPFDKPEIIKNYLARRPVTLFYNNLNTPDKPGGKEIPIEQWKEKEIIAYLYRNKIRNKRLKAFLPNSFEHLVLRNNRDGQKSGRENYDQLKLKLDGYVFYAFNRFRQRMNEVAVFSYTFDFIDEEKICIANRHPIGNPNKIEYTGEMFLKAEKIYMDLNDANMQHRKQFIAPFNCIPEDSSRTFVFRGITSSVSTLTGNPMALRELIVCIPDTNGSQQGKSFIRENDKTNGYISYKDFCNLPSAILKNEEKLFLANQSMSTLTFPAKTDTTFIYYRQDKARKYEGCYSLYSFSSEPNINPLKMALDIDSLSQVILKIKYDSEPEAEICIYYGVCEFYNNSLRIGVHFSSEYPNDERHSEFIFDPINEKNYKKPFMLAGINLTTNDENKALAMRFIAVRNDWLMPRLGNTKPVKPGEPGIGLSNHRELKKIEHLLKEEGIIAGELSNYLLKRSSVSIDSTTKKLTRKLSSKHLYKST